MQTESVRAPGRWISFLGPAFLILVLVGFFAVPGSTLDKFYMVCFGI